MHPILIIIISVFAFFAVGFVISYIIVNRIMFVRFFQRCSDKYILSNALRDSYYDNCREEMKAAAEKLNKLPYRTITTTAEDGIRLSARYYCRGNENLIIFAHGVHSYPPYCFGVFCLEAYERNFDLLIVDQRAHWQSEGKYITYGKKESSDLLRWLDAVDSDKIKNIYLFGVSMGASTIGFAADKISDSRVKALVMDCGFTSTGNLIKHILQSHGVPKFMFAPSVFLAGRTIGVSLTDTTEDCLRKTSIPTLFIHGDSDTVVPKEESERNYRACAAKKQLLIAENAGHACASVVGGADLREKIFDFLGGNI